MANKITKIETAIVVPRWGLLRVHTADGIFGFGEFTVEGQHDSTCSLVKELSPHFLGKDPSEIKKLVRGVYDQLFYHGGPHLMSALGGIEMALWDIYGKSLNQPIHQLLGGAVRNKIKVYRWAGGNNNSPELAAEEAAKVVSEGARAIKMNACPPLAAIDTYGGIQAAVKRAAAVRKAVGPDVDIAFDFHGRANVPMARRLVKELEFSNPLFYEEPVRPDYNRWLPEIASLTHVPIATGERMFTPAEFFEAISNKGVHVLQPDLVHVGGISNTLEIAAMAEANGIAIAPHCPLSPIAFMACLQVMATSRAAWILEWSKGIHYNASGALGSIDPWLRYIKEEQRELFQLDRDGHLPISSLPGLGFEVDWNEVLKAAEQGVSWRDEQMVLNDGTKANW